MGRGVWNDRACLECIAAWDTALADEAYRQQVDILAQQQVCTAPHCNFGRLVWMLSESSARVGVFVCIIVPWNGWSGEAGLSSFVVGEIHRIMFWE